MVRVLIAGKCLKFVTAHQLRALPAVLLVTFSHTTKHNLAVARPMNRTSPLAALAVHATLNHFLDTLGLLQPPHLLKPTDHRFRRLFVKGYTSDWAGAAVQTTRSQHLSTILCHHSLLYYFPALSIQSVNKGLLIHYT
jgi:hypothetical protein